MNISVIKVDNGVNVEHLLGARTALTEAPEAAKFKWRATCDWVRGTHSRTTVQNFYGLGAEQMFYVDAVVDFDDGYVHCGSPSSLVPAGGRVRGAR